MNGELLRSKAEEIKSYSEEIDPVDAVRPITDFEVLPQVEHKDGKTVHFGALRPVRCDIAGGKSDLALTERGMQSLCERIGVPFNFMVSDRLDDDLRYAIMNSVIHDDKLATRYAAPATVRTFVHPVTQDRMVRAVMSDKYAPIDSAKIVETIARHVDEKPKDQRAVEIQTFEYDFEGLHLRASFPNVTLPASMDGYQAAIHTHNSEVGTSALWLKAMIFVLICTNGMMDIKSKEVGRQIHVGDDINVDATVRLMLQRSEQRVFSISEVYAAAQAIKIKHPTGFIPNAVNANAGFRQWITPAALEARESRPYPSTLAGMVDSLTEGAQKAQTIDDRIEHEIEATRLLYMAKRASVYDHSIEKAA